ncbi:hypothetical protein SSIN_0263 [Streptococcus sinensis]|uniref:Uncharacterized protein n=1 Tax=Streptococcus sinensis TaxID=176090 RepID=A0A0A0DJE2_9STRE|nr:hypothetical protein SSIN_0263 [Streptococcus sinensis]
MFVLKTQSFKSSHFIEGNQAKYSLLELGQNLLLGWSLRQIDIPL